MQQFIGRGIAGRYSPDAVEAHLKEAGYQLLDRRRVAYKIGDRTSKDFRIRSVNHVSSLAPVSGIVPRQGGAGDGEWAGGMGRARAALTGERAERPGFCGLDRSKCAYWLLCSSTLPRTPILMVETTQHRDLHDGMSGLRREGEFAGAPLTNTLMRPRTVEVEAVATKDRGERRLAAQDDQSAAIQFTFRPSGR
jgi:hypothetical protein